MNVATHLLLNDMNDTFSVVSFNDLQGEISKEFVYSYVATIVEKNPLLRKTIVYTDAPQSYFREKLVLQDIENFRQQDYISLHYINHKQFKRKNIE